VAAATGDALGAPYEFQAPVVDSEEIDMIGGGVLGWQPGEWTDDTAMAIVVLEASLTASDCHDLRIESAQDHIAREWYSWSLGTPDIGNLTSHVLRSAADIGREAGHYAPRAVDFRAAAAKAHEDHPTSAGNGSLMRAHASVLPYLLSTEAEAAEAIASVCRLTHVHPDTVEACLLWGLAVRHAILTGELDVRVGLDQLDPERRAVWQDRIEEAEESTPVTFRRNGWVVGAFQAAWAAINGVRPIPEGKFAQRDALVAALEAAARAG
jgi:ADP-ribosylglycohydrolase